MRQSPGPRCRSTRFVRLRQVFVDMVALATIGSLVLFGGLVGPAMASASSSPTPISLQSAGSFAILARATITNTGNSVITGNVGLYPGTSVTGFPPGGPAVVNGTMYVGDATAQQAIADLGTAYTSASPSGTAAAGDTSTTVAGGLLNGQTFGPGVYNSTSGLNLTTTVTLDAQGNANAVFIFQAGSTLTTAAASSVVLAGGAQACNVFWQVGSSATLGATTAFMGTILAGTSVTLDQGASVNGRVLAGATSGTGAVTLIDNGITTGCTTTTTAATPVASVLTTAVSHSTITLGSSVTDVATVTGTTAGGTPTGSVQFYTCAVGNTSCTAASGTAQTPIDGLVGGTATSPSFTPSTVGTYCFAAVYTPSGTTYTGTSETGTSLDAECFTVTAASAVTPPVTPPVLVPTAHTGEPWAGWVYWALIGAAGILGITLAMQGVTRRRSTRRTEH